MDREQFLRQQSEWLEPLIWQDTPEQLRAREASLAARFHSLIVTVKEVLGEFSDEGLILAIQKGFLAKEAFEELLENRYKKRLFRWCAHWGLTFEDTEDLTHTVFLKFWMSGFDSYQAQGKSDNFRSFLWTVAYHQWLQDRRTKKPIFLDRCPEASTNGHSGEHRAQELEEQLEVALRRLPDLDQRVMRAALAKRTLPEIASELGLTYQAVAMRLFRARRFLEEALELPQRSRTARGAS
jgi:RNA polymerase sigma factor (sigma-70 family)